MSRRRSSRAARRRRKGGTLPFDILPFDIAREVRAARRAGVSLLTLSLCLIAFGLVLRFGVPFGIDDRLRDVGIEDARDALPPAAPSDRLSATFAICDGPVRDDCVVDGDTFWFGGDKYRIADINTPETSSPDCDAELALGLRATRRLAALLNADRFSLAPADRDIDRYGRKLRIPTRGGESLGAVLVAEGLAENWKGYRGSWC